MLEDFLQKTVRIERELDYIFDGSVSASLDFEQLPEDAFLSCAVSGVAALTITATGLLDGITVTEEIYIADDDGNRGFQKFDSLSSLGCEGALSGLIKITPLNEDAEPILYASVLGTYSMDSSYRPEDHSLESFGEQDNLRGRIYKYYSKPEVDVREDDILIDGRNRYRVQSVVLLRSISGWQSHNEIAVSKFPAKDEF